MRVLVVAQLPATDVEADRAMAERLGFVDGQAAGCLFRLAGPSDDGWRVATLWESNDAFEAWRDGRLAATLQATGQRVPPFEVWPVEHAIGI